MPEDERRAQSVGDQQNPGDGCQAVFGRRFPLSAGVDVFWAMPARVHKPVLAQSLVRSIQPCFRFSNGCVELANDGGGKGLLGHRGYP